MKIDSSLSQEDHLKAWTLSRSSAPRAVQSAAILASASGKAIIVGEHAVVYGARAVAMPVVSMRMGVKLTRLPETKMPHGDTPRHRVLLGGRSVSDHLTGVIDEAFDALGERPFPVAIEGMSSVLIGAGLGSSASLCIVVLRALAQATGRELGPEELCRLGNRLERRFHGNPSGLDTAVVALEQVISFVKGQTPKPISLARIPDPAGAERKLWRFALLDSGARSSTLAMIQAAAPYFQATDGTARLARFDDLAERTVKGLAAGDALLVADAMREAGGLLAEANVVGDALASLIGVANDVGVLAAKSTGAGGGGCVLALLHPEEANAQVAALKARLGANVVHEVSL